MAKRKPNQQSEPITPKEIIANEPEVRETPLSERYESFEQVMGLLKDVQPESIAALESAELDKAMEAPITAEQSAKEILEKADVLLPSRNDLGDIVSGKWKPITEDEMILYFLEGKTGFVRLNELLKSLYGVPSFSVPAQWLQQGESRRLKGVLQRLVDAGKIEVKNNAHQTLGNFYYGEDTKQKHRNLNDTIIEAATKK